MTRIKNDELEKLMLNFSKCTDRDVALLRRIDLLQFNGNLQSTKTIKKKAENAIRIVLKRVKDHILRQKT